MQIDRKMLDRLLALDDEQLLRVIRTVIEKGGLDADSFNIRPNDIAAIRRALSGASEEDLRRAAEQLNQRRGGNHG